jgi:succinoglycan biosynthesis protein ExoA
MIPTLATLYRDDSRNSTTPPSKFFISVIVPVRNEADHIRRTLSQLLNQNYNSDSFEVIVVDGQSTDATWDIVGDVQASHPNLQLLSNPKRWSSAGRNVAVRQALSTYHSPTTTHLLVIIDGHCDLDDPDYLSQLAHAFERSGADCVGRPQPLDVGQANPLQRAIALARSSSLGHHPDSFIYSNVETYVPPESVAVAYRREVFDHVGLFDEAFDACEDVEFNHRVAQAGFRCFFTPRVQVRYVPRARWSGLVRQMVRYGRGRIRLLRKHKDTAGIACFLPAILLCGMAMGPVTLASRWFMAAYLSGLGFYLLVVFAFSLSLAWKAREIRLLPWLALVFVTVHLSAGAGLLQELNLGVWSGISTAFGQSARPSDKPVEILALRTRQSISGSEKSETSVLEQGQGIPQSLAG